MLKRVNRIGALLVVLAAQWAWVQSGAAQMPQANMVWSSYLGGSSADAAYGTAMDATGNIYVTGATASTGWASGGFDTSYNGGTSDAFVIKLSAAGQLLWSTYLGGSGNDWAQGIAINHAGEVCVSGVTFSSGWVSGGYDTVMSPIAFGTAFVAKLSANGQHLWSTYVGDAWNAYGIAVDGQDNICVTGLTDNGGWASGGYDTTFNSPRDGFVAKLSSTGQHLWSTYIGGGTGPGTTGEDYCRGIAVDADGNMIVVGLTNSDNSSKWISGGYNTTYGGGQDGFVVKISAAGQHLWSTYLGGAGQDTAMAVAVDPAGAICVTGYTYSAGWVRGGYNTQLNPSDQGGFAVRLSPAGQLIWSTYLGGDKADKGAGVALDSAGNAYLVGTTASSNWISGDISNAFNLGDSAYIYCTDAYLIKLSLAGRPLWSTYVGGKGDDEGYGVATDGKGNICVVGGTCAGAWTAGGYDTTLSGSSTSAISFNDGFVAKIHDNALPTTEPLGAVGVAIQPPDAVAMGAQWRRAGTTAWRDSGTTETGVPAGPCLVEFKPIQDWIPPAGQLLVTTASQTAVTSGTYMKAASLCVTINPPAAAAAGAKWRRVGTLPWLDSQATERTIAPGSYTVEFKAAPGWLAPASQPVTLASGQAGITSGTFTAGAILRVNIQPPAAVSAGGQWRRMGTTQWRNSNTSETDLTAGAATVEFKSVTGWNKPASVPVTLVAGQVATTTGTYDNRTGALQVTIGPPAAVAAGGQWRRAGTTAWHDSGTSEPAVLIGNYLVEFKQVPGMSIPLPRDIIINYNQLTTTTAAYPPVVSELSWSTYAGGNGSDTCYELALDKDGNILIVGETYSDGWVAGGYDTTFGGDYSDDAFVAKITPAGQMLWSTYLGGTSSEIGRSVTVDHAGNIYATGYTWSKDWVSGGYNTTYNGAEGSDCQAFLVKLTPGGAHLWSTYMGGRGTDMGFVVAVDKDDNVLVGGITYTDEWIAGGFNTHYGGGQDDSFVIKFTSAGQPLWSTLLGGGGADYPWGLETDAAGNIYVAGDTTVGGWASGGAQTQFQGGVRDSYLVKLTPDGGHLWSTYLGGRGTDSCSGLALDGAGNIYVIGYSDAGGWLTGGYDTIHRGSYDGYVVKLNSAGQIAWGTFLGGIGADYCHDLAVTRSGNLALAGYTTSTNWVSGGSNATNSGGTDAFVMMLSPTGQHLWSTLLGGSNYDYGYGVAADDAENVFVCGETFSQGWTTGPDKVFKGGSTDVFVAKIHPTSAALRVTIVPPAAVAAGGQWRRVGTGAWLDSGMTETGLTTGSQTVEFKPVAGWAAPPNQTLMLAGTVTTATVGVYRCVSGGLQVTLAPPAAVAAGAGWRRVGTSNWLASGATESGVSTGSCAIEFKPIPYWMTPAGQTVAITLGETAATSATYGPLGDLAVVITPPEAVAAGAQWRRVGTTAWRMSGTTETLIPAQAYDIEFKAVAGWTAPAGVKATVPQGRAVTASGAYARQTGSLCVTITPSGAVAAGARWRRAGTAMWLPSGATEANVSVGSCWIEFLPLANWKTPASVQVTITAGQTARSAGTYTRSTVDGDAWMRY